MLLLVPEVVTVSLLAPEGVTVSLLAPKMAVVSLLIPEQTREVEVRANYKTLLPRIPRSARFGEERPRCRRTRC